MQTLSHHPRKTVDREVNHQAVMVVAVSCLSAIAIGMLAIWLT